MTSCCSTSDNNKTPTGKHRCPVDGETCGQVSILTILHHLKAPWSWHAKQQNYFFCDAPDCEVIYFGEDSSVIYKSDLRTLVGVKENSVDAPLCYCFGVSKADATQTPAAKAFVVQQTKTKQCACETRNPSGQCCLKDFPEQRK